MKRWETRPGASPPKLVFVLGDLKFGGTQRQTLHIARLLDRSRFDVEVWLMAGDDELTPLAREWGIPLVFLSKRPGVGPTGVVNLARRLFKYRPDLMMLFTHIPNIWGCLWGFLSRAPLMVGSCRDGLPRWQHERWLWPLTDHLVSNCRSIEDRLVNDCHVPRKRITLIYNGVDAEYFRPPDHRSGPPVVLSVGRLVPVKAHDVLIKAFAIVLPRHPRAELWIAGDGPRLGELTELARKNLPPGKAKFLASRQDISPLYKKADLFALPSLAEAMPNVVLEAMGSGLPVVASRVGGVPELVKQGQTGWLVPPGKPEALAGALDKLLSNPHKRTLFGRAGRERVESDFSMTVMVKRHEEIFARLLGER